MQFFFQNEKNKTKLEAISLELRAKIISLKLGMGSMSLND